MKEASETPIAMTEASVAVGEVIACDEKNKIFSAFQPFLLIIMKGERKSELGMHGWTERLASVLIF